MTTNESIIEAEISGFETEYGLTVLSVGNPSLGASIRLHLDENIGEGPLRLLIHARDVALALSKPSDTSLQNCLPVKVTEISVSDNAHMMIACDVEGQKLFSQITKKSFDELKLEPGKKVFALIKSVALA